MSFANFYPSQLEKRLSGDDVVNRNLILNSLSDLDLLLTGYFSLVDDAGFDRRVIGEALDITFRHKGLDLRKNGSLYVAHPLRVSKYIIEQFGCSNQVLVVAGLLHDVPEDIPVYHNRPDLIENRFGSEVSEIVLGMTNQKLSPELKREYSARVEAELGYNSVTTAAVIKHLEYFLGIEKKIQDPRVLVVKSADIRGNVSSIHRLDPGTRSRIAAKYAPTVDLFLEGFKGLADLSDQLGIDANSGRDMTMTFISGRPMVEAYVQEWQHYEAQQQAFDLLLGER